MKRILTVLFLLTARSLSAQDVSDSRWVRVGATSTGSVWIDTLSIQSAGPRKSAWAQFRHSSPRTSPAGTVDIELVRTTFDCGANTYSTQEYVSYFRDRVVASGAMDKQWQSPPPQSIAEAKWTYICRAGVGVGQSRSPSWLFVSRNSDASGSAFTVVVDTTRIHRSNGFAIIWTRAIYDSLQVGDMGLYDVQEQLLRFDCENRRNAINDVKFYRGETRLTGGSHPVDPSMFDLNPTPKGTVADTQLNIACNWTGKLGY